MEKWEYLSITLTWDEKAGQWQANTPSGVFLRGNNFGAALNIEGSQGWELVSVFVGEWAGYGELPRWHRAVFKRRGP